MLLTNLPNNIIANSQVYIYIMRILYYSSPSFGDCDLPLIKALMDKGHEVYVLYFINPHCLKSTIFNIEKIYPKCGIFPISIYPELISFQKYVPLNHFYIANEPTGRFGWYSFRTDMKVLSFFRKVNPDVINYVINPSVFHCFPLWFFRNKMVSVIHDGKPHSGEENKKNEIIRKITTKYIRKFILLNNNEVNIFSKAYQVPKKKIFVSHLGYYDILNLYGDPNTCKQQMILFFGRISKYKGIEYLLEAMRIVHKKYPHVKVVIAGKGKFSFDITQYQALEYVEFRNRFIGLDELANLIRSALVTVCPYTDATQSGVVYSSFALNTPVIATNVGGLPEMIDDEKTGLIVSPKDSYTLANAILRLLDNPTELNTLANNISLSAKTGKGSWEKVASDYIKVYETLQ